MKVVKVYGELKKRLGQGTFELNVQTPAEAIRALCANFQGLEKWFIDNDQNGIAYKVLVDKKIIYQENVEELHYPLSDKEVFSIAPVVQGAGGGIGRFFLGAALVAGAFFFTPLAAGKFFAGAGVTGSWAAAGFWTKTAVMMGGALMLGGIAQMLSPQPPKPTDPSKNESFGFGGVTNTIHQGVPVPICYGRLYVGSATISVGLDTDEVA